MPNYHFQCAAHGDFESMSQYSEPNGVESRPCPKCGESAPMVWRRAPAMRKLGYEAVHFGGRNIPVESIEKALDQPKVDDDAGFWDEPSFEKEFFDVRDQKAAQWFAGDLPPDQLTPQEIETLKEGVGKS